VDEMVREGIVEEDAVEEDMVLLDEGMAKETVDVRVCDVVAVRVMLLLGMQVVEVVTAGPFLLCFSWPIKLVRLRRKRL
jgi:hypothetical protein